MKKLGIRLTSLTVGMALALSLTACGSSSVPSEAVSSAPASSEAAAPEAPAAFDYSLGLDKDGRWEGVTALDYVTLPENYASFPLPAEVTQVNPEQIEQYLQSLPYNYSTVEDITDRAIEAGDSVNIDYVGSVDGVEFTGGSTQGMGTLVTAGAKNYIDDFLDQIIGHNIGDTFDVNVTFPEGYNDSTDAEGNAMVLAGKDAVFVTTINSIQKTVVPEMNDAFVAESLTERFDGATTVDELRAVLTENAIMGQIMQFFAAPDGFAASCEFAEEMPASIVEVQEKMCVNYFRQEAAKNGMSFEDFIGTYFEGISTEEELLERQDEAILASAHQAILLQALAETQNLTVTDDFVAEYLKENEGVEDLTPYLENYGMEYLKNYVQNYAMTDFLAENAQRA